MNKNTLFTLFRQLSNFWTINDEEVALITRYFETVMQKCITCYENCDNKYCKDISREGGKYLAFRIMAHLPLFLFQYSVKGRL